MTKIHRNALLLLLLCAALAPSPLSPRASASDSARAAAAKHAAAQSTTEPVHMAIIGYWSATSTNWDSVPDDSVVVINPSSGILKENTLDVVGNTVEWTNLVEKLKDPNQHKNVKVLGYVPTGYFRHLQKCAITPGKNPHCQEWARIQLQVDTYYDKVRRQGQPSKLDGIFYDETAPKNGMTTSFEKEYEDIRKTNKPGRTTVFNIGAANSKALAATLKDEHIVLYESTPGGYGNNPDLITLTKDASDRGVIVWHLLYDVGNKKEMCSYVKLMADRKARYGYVTNFGVNDAWNKRPKYWDEERDAFATQGQNCKKK